MRTGAGPFSRKLHNKKARLPAGWAADPVFLGCFTTIRTGSAGSDLPHRVEPVLSVQEIVTHINM